MFERFTDAARGVVNGAQVAARELKHPYIGTEHLLLAMLTAETGTAVRALTEAGLTAPAIRAKLQEIVPDDAQPLSKEDRAALQTIGIDLDAVLSKIEESFGPEALMPPPLEAKRGLLRRKPRNGTRFAARSRKVLELSLREALRLKDNYIGTEHLLLGLIREGNGLAVKLITDAGVDLDELRRATEAARGRTST
ncbi:ATP-dependent Clp protease ATP-binding subunit ClpA [Allocatelliglobosispora scoriae]|uniref:ATP-dependent Clp protease ATP-binding subunit ClpA n=1 Tax=Allocatelliglobosispora scoriae TaxID=643052 RepID=A0A841BN57_9ACTN|nr:Clp protease N-terminal domain-containing protein [Allocatelliglobosispora scoriae]MBB5868182.1 ATP-dependent Clp protease ATP-binding subunit ClpA [Allocatelliglobosispora scoriae]